MPGNVLIDTYLDRLGRRLPAKIVSELTDGLLETYANCRAAGLDDNTAARAAIAEFGDIEQITSEFILRSAGRSTARTLLATGPVVGACWGAALILGRLWTWPVPTTARIAFGSSLILVITILVTAATSRRSYRRTRLAVVGGLGLVALDTVLIVAALTVSPSMTRLVVLAVAASLTRIGLAIRIVPRIAFS